MSLYIGTLHLLSLKSDIFLYPCVHLLTEFKKHLSPKWIIESSKEYDFYCESIWKFKFFLKWSEVYIFQNIPLGANKEFIFGKKDGKKKGQKKKNAGKEKKQEKEGEKLANIWPFTAFFPQKRKITLNFPILEQIWGGKVHWKCI